MAKTPEQSDHTSTEKRIDCLTQGIAPKRSIDKFVGIREGIEGIPFKLADYIELVEWTGRIIHPNKRGFISIRRDCPS